MDKKVQIVLGKDGSIKVEASGFKGTSCEEATAFLDKIFAVDKRKHKSSYYEEGETICNSLPSGLCG